MTPLTPQMLESPYLLGFADGTMSSEEFCLEKTAKLIGRPLKFATKKDWLAYNERVWDWMEQDEVRFKEAEAAQIISSLEEDPVLFEIIRERVLQAA